jgi:pimeloyl-ACP methyl ester carboxylesterase
LSQNHKFLPGRSYNFARHFEKRPTTEREMKSETQRYRVNGIDMNVVIAGEGPDVLLVHGYPDTHDVWRKQIPALVEAGYRVIAPDMRGCGETEMPSKVSDYRIGNLVADLVALLDVLRIQKARVIAHDWGAAIAWRLAITHPERVDCYIPLSVGHPNAYAQGGMAQKLKGYYILLMQLRGLTEFLCTRANWFIFRAMTRYPRSSRVRRPACRGPGVWRRE